MIVREILAAIVLFIGTIFATISALGVHRSKNNFAALHCAGVTNVMLPLLALIAVILIVPAGQSTVKMAVLFVVLTLGGPITSHAIAVAEYRRKSRR
jgi:monovalent cation/proton antiporter MnhG/PhaG subunit